MSQHTGGCCIYFNSAEWAFESALAIQERVEACIRERGSCNIFLTGGRSAEKLYRQWFGLEPFRNSLLNCNFYFSDERAVPPDHADSNYGMVMNSLFQNGLGAAKASIFRMEADSHDLEMTAVKYERLIGAIDILILTAGDDGHIASLFPGNRSLFEQTRKVVVVNDENQSIASRLSISPLVIRQAGQVFVLAPGLKKASILNIARKDQNNVLSLPVRLVLNACWLLDTKAVD